MEKLKTVINKYWKVYVVALILATVCDLIGTLKFNIGIGTLTLFPMVFAMLEIISSEFLYKEYPDKPEGELTKLRASIVCEPTLALCTKDIALGEYLLLGKGEDQTGGRGRKSILSDALEAVIGAIYLDGGFANAKEFIHKYILTDIEHKQLFYDSKTILQEVVQGEHEQLTYVLTDESGPDHNKSFTVRACIGERVIGSGTGHTKKAAEQEAAYQALLMLKNQQRG